MSKSKKSETQTVQNVDCARDTTVLAKSQSGAFVIEDLLAVNQANTLEGRRGSKAMEK